MNYWKNTSQGSVASIYHSESHEGGADSAREEILRSAEKEEADMIVVDRRGLSTASELLLEAYQTM